MKSRLLKTLPFSTASSELHCNAKRSSADVACMIKFAYDELERYILNTLWRSSVVVCGSTLYNLNSESGNITANIQYL